MENGNYSLGDLYITLEGKSTHNNVILMKFKYSWDVAISSSTFQRCRYEYDIIVCSCGQSICYVLFIYPFSVSFYLIFRVQLDDWVGLDFIQTYAFWNVHQPEPDTFYFEENAGI